MTESDLLWLAGLFEGGITTGVRGVPNNRHIFVECFSTDLELVETLLRLFAPDGGIYERETSRGATSYHWMLCGQAAAKLLSLVGPCVKTAKAKRLAAFGPLYLAIPYGDRKAKEALCKRLEQVNKPPQKKK